MSEFAKSFASLVKSNNGMFKSEKQAALLLAACDGGEYTALGSLYGNSYNNVYVCDAEGVVRVEHYTYAKGNKIIWERVEAGKVSVQESKEFKRVQREIKALEKKIAERDAHFAKGGYADITLYTESNNRDKAALAEFVAMLGK